MLKIGVLASGRGSNFQAMIDEGKADNLKVSIECLITDTPACYAIKRAEENGIPAFYINPDDYKTKDLYYHKIAYELKSSGVGLVLLAGFMRVVRKPLLDAYPMRIMNVHPSLLPAFRGLDAQKQALDFGVKVAGCTVHFVDEGVDTGPIIIQAAVSVIQGDNAESLSDRILKLEHKIYPYAVKLFSEGRLRVEGRTVVIKGGVDNNGFLTNPPV
ncbi:MAG: phosphoribosylglycinamide formyltransferase [Nitrospirae bacterium]|nr:phosphoribosylglycinamide formyltransferase [Nitrospirota bacterium]